MKFIYAVIAGFILDLIFGDPQYSFHPIRAIGKLIEVSEKFTRKLCPKSNKGELFAGVLTVLFVSTITFSVTFATIKIANSINIYVGFAIESILCYLVLATKSLKTESMKVYYPLKDGDVEKARYAVSMIVGRDTANLSDVQIAKAAVETVAENTSDGVIAPLIFLAIGGAPFGFLYKAINTMDSMIAYKNEKYMYFGRFAAKLDDIVNYIPSRLSAIFMIIASFFIGLDWKNAFKIFKRDRYNHESPNSAQTEAVCAGALNIMLAGDAYYFGKIHKKPTIGDNNRPVCFEDIKLANRLLYATAIVGIIVVSLINLLITRG
ncbi:MAG: adenosylcobinamide-phosphate synthase CbiB [Oscillospiraceae bacterium]